MHQKDNNYSRLNANNWFFFFCGHLPTQIQFNIQTSHGMLNVCMRNMQNTITYNAIIFFMNICVSPKTQTNNSAQSLIKNNHTFSGKMGNELIYWGISALTTILSWRATGNISSPPLLTATHTYTETHTQQFFTYNGKSGCLLNLSSQLAQIRSFFIKCLSIQAAID